MKIFQYTKIKVALVTVVIILNVLLFGILFLLNVLKSCACPIMEEGTECTCYLGGVKIPNLLDELMVLPLIVLILSIFYLIALLIGKKVMSFKD
jgi:hypothetical protein